MMFYQRSNVFNFILILMAIVTISKTEDYYLDSAKNSYVEYKHVSSGSGLTFCSWMKLGRDPFIEFVDSLTENEGKLPFYANIDKKEIYSSATQRSSFGATYSDSLLSMVKNYSTWFHICITRNESFFNFYANGQPIQDYENQEEVDPITKNIQLKIQIGSLLDSTNNASFFQTNVFDRSITAKEVADMYNCKTVEGDFLSWSKITSKSQDVSFENNISLMEGDVPCPTSSLNPNAAAGMSNSRDPGSSSENSGQSPNSGSSNQPPSSGSSNQVPSSGSSNQVPSSGSSKTSNQGSSSENDIPGSSSAK